MSDTLATLRQALAPKAGMKRIPFPLESYQHPSLPLSAKRLLNLYAEQAPSDARTAAPLVPTPGLVFIETLASGVVYAFNTDLIGGFYAVCGNRAFRNIEGVTSDIGVVGTASDALLNPNQYGVTIAVGQTAAVICVPPRAFICAHDGGTLNEIGGTFPGALSVTYIDNYFVFTNKNRGTTFFISIIDDPSMFDALDFANLEGHVNVLYRAITHNNELWLGGAAGWEVWYDTGDADFPFRRRAGGIISRSIATPHSIAQLDNSVFWVGDEGVVYRTVGYQALRVSTHAIEAILQAGNPADCTAVSYMQNGHSFYCLTLGTRTVCYDCATKLWHDRSSNEDGTAAWRPTVAGRIQEASYVGDAFGNLFGLDPAVGTENGVAVPRSFTLPPIYAGTNRAFCNRLEIEMEVGTAASNGYLLLEWSNDGGTTWIGSRLLNAGTIGQLRKRVVTTRLGSFRQRVFRVTVYDRGTFYAVDADVSAGNS